eukprot:9111808-Heterocapsa_arctica.AAC.1
MPGGRTVAVRGPRGLHRRRTRAKVLKDCRFPVLVGNAISLEHHSTLQLAFGVASRKLRVLLGAQGEEIPK